jgi:APA family basic amino acid/polyamine antiporter
LEEDAMARHWLFRTKSLEDLLGEMAGEHRLRRALGPGHLTALGVGAVIGAGIFVATGKAASEVAGPSLMLSYCIAGTICVFAALCYAEFAAMAPVAGSAYTYAYATLGEIFAWIIGWDLVLEYAVGAATVANGWSGYFQSVLGKFGVVFPKALSGSALAYSAEGEPFVWTGSLSDPVALFVDCFRYFGHHFHWTDRIFDLPAVLIVLGITVLLVVGIRESARFNAAMVAVKVSTILFVILVGVFYINWDNYTPFAPYGWTGVSLFGYPLLGQTTSKGDPQGMLAGAAIIFFAYIGFDAVSTNAEEAKNPQRDLPIGIIASLVICTLLYVGVVAVLTGMVPYDQIDKDAGVSDAFGKIGLEWADMIIAAAGVAGITSVLLVMMLSAPRVFLAMSRDGLLPPQVFASVHPRFQTPWKSSIIVGVSVALLAGVFPIDALLHMTNIGTLFAFTMVCTAVLVMRRTNPDAHRPFRCPFVPLLPALGILGCLTLMCSLPPANWFRLLGWLGLGLVVYFLYGRRHSRLGVRLQQELALQGLTPAGSPADPTKNEP